MVSLDCRSGAIVDQFLGVGGAADVEPYSMQCPDGLQAIGFKVSSSCFALTVLQVSCLFASVSMVAFMAEHDE